MKPHHAAGTLGIVLGTLPIAVVAWASNSFGPGPLVAMAPVLAVACTLAEVVGFGLMVIAIAMEAARQTDIDS